MTKAKSSKRGRTGTTEGTEIHGQMWGEKKYHVKGAEQRIADHWSPCFYSVSFRTTNNSFLRWARRISGGQPSLANAVGKKMAGKKMKAYCDDSSHHLSTTHLFAIVFSFPLVAAERSEAALGLPWFPLGLPLICGFSPRGDSPVTLFAAERSEAALGFPW